MDEIQFAIDLVRRLGMVRGGRRWGNIRKSRNQPLLAMLGRSTNQAIKSDLKETNPLAYYDLLSFSAAVSGSYALSIDLLDQCMAHGEPVLGVSE